MPPRSSRGDSLGCQRAPSGRPKARDFRGRDMRKSVNGETGPQMSTDTSEAMAKTSAGLGPKTSQTKAIMATAAKVVDRHHDILRRAAA